MLQKICFGLIILLAGFLPLELWANSVVTGYRVADKADFSRVVFDVSSVPSYKVFKLKDPDRVVIDIAGAKWQESNEPHKSTKRIKEVRYANKDKSNLRIVVDYNADIKDLKNFTLKKDSKNPARIVVDIASKGQSFAKAPLPISKKGNSIAAPKPKLKSRKKPVIVIDAGHGGRDPGAIGRKGTKEKDVTLKYAKHLKKELEKTGRYKVYLTRKNDKYLQLRERVMKARKYKGDLFISLHADSHKNRKINGLSVYTLSERASDKEAAALARRENNSDIIGGIEFEDKEISDLLVDLVQRDTMNVSANFAENIVKYLQKETKLLHNPHRFAGFRVLTAAEIPSVLIELGYMSNRREEKKLKTKKHKKKLASSIVRAIDNHFRKYKVN